MNDAYVKAGSLWVPRALAETQAEKFERMQRVAEQLLAEAHERWPGDLRAMALSGQTSQIDKLQVGYSPRFTAVQAATLVRAGVGILVAFTTFIAAGAGGTIQFFDGNTTPQALTGVFDATKGPSTLWTYAAFGNTANGSGAAQGLFITIAVAVTDVIAITAGI